MEFISQNVFEIVSIFIAAAALVYAALAFSASKQALKITRDSDTTAMRVKVQDGLSNAERSFLLLQEACQTTRRDWENHNRQHLPSLGSSFGRSMFGESDETQHISAIERSGSQVLRELMATVPKPDVLDAPELETFIKKAQSASMQIERLKFGLEGPRPLRL
ncbi:hypothetical protein FTO60_04240 [Octadecabacter sp. SW4]|uniref:hypothetical protein n=1 Tax=Octadecabacter sp. SW4 TaxID=2602067 RepID=UPI0011C1F475|nr:hypothetical protein [Octadecabacter sp. SW4]QEE34990.1 hypothetical protein FTO60_04240 [Octadecabacter sp. SW4]